MRLPTVLTRGETRKVLRQMKGTQHLVASVLYGSGLRLKEGLQLRLKDLDLDGRELRVRGAKGGRERVSVVPAVLVGPLTEQIERRRAIHERDLAAGFGWALLPGSVCDKITEVGHRVGLAVPLSCLDLHRGPAHRSSGQISSPPHVRATSSENRGPGPRSHQASHLPHPPAFLRDSSTRGWLRHTHHPGATWTPKREDHHDLHPRPEPGWLGHT